MPLPLLALGSLLGGAGGGEGGGGGGLPGGLSTSSEATSTVGDLDNRFDFGDINIGAGIVTSRSGDSLFDVNRLIAVAIIGLTVVGAVALLPFGGPNKKSVARKPKKKRKAKS